MENTAMLISDIVITKGACLYEIFHFLNKIHG